jgi:3-oxoacyl-[acyl-carrier-protein] synthase-3
MGKRVYSVFNGSGSYVPDNIVKNEDFMSHTFYDESGSIIDRENEEIIDKFQQITGIQERRYANKEHNTSDMAYFAALDAIESSGIDKEELDYIIVAHNFGDITYGSTHSDFLPAIASRVKSALEIENPFCVAYDLPFGCPGWLQGVIQADYYIRSGEAKKILVIGAEVLSRIYDPHDRDAMIFSDGAGAVIMEGKESEEEIGILGHLTRSDTKEHAWLLKMGKSNNPSISNRELFMKMNGRKLYEYAITTVPATVKKLMDKLNMGVGDIAKVLIHQANEKMDDVMLARVFRLFKIREIPKNIMPMTIGNFGNNSVATIPIMYDLISKGKMDGHQFNSGDNLVFTSVGAGMNTNAMIYKMI